MYFASWTKIKPGLVGTGFRWHKKPNPPGKGFTYTDEYNHPDDALYLTALTALANLSSINFA